jgi:hypothetical protein
MRLLNTTTFELEEFFGANIPQYAILSHRHGNSEVTFQDVLNGKGLVKEGWRKILGCCAQARKDGWNWVVSLHNPHKTFDLYRKFCDTSLMLAKSFLVDRYLLHRQKQQLGAVRSNQLDVPLVSAITSLLRILIRCSGERPRRL